MHFDPSEFVTLGVFLDIATDISSPAIYTYTTGGNFDAAIDGFPPQEPGNPWYITGISVDPVGADTTFTWVGIFGSEGMCDRAISGPLPGEATGISVEIPRDGKIRVALDQSVSGGSIFLRLQRRRRRPRCGE